MRGCWRAVIAIVLLQVIWTGNSIVSSAQENNRAYLYNVDEQGNPLAGAQYTLIYAGGKAETVITDESGKVILDLAPGQYTLVETRTAKGYFPNKKSIKFAVKENLTMELADNKLVNVQLKNDGMELNIVNMLKPPSAYLQENTPEAAAPSRKNHSDIILLAGATAIVAVVVVIINKKRQEPNF